VYAAALLGRGDALDTVHARLIAQLFVYPLAADLYHYFFIAAQVGLRLAQYARIPPRVRRVCLIHVGQLFGKKRSLFPTCPCAHFEYCLVGKLLFLLFLIENLLYLGQNRLLLLLDALEVIPGQVTKLPRGQLLYFRLFVEQALKLHGKIRGLRIFFKF
jgi:hypothetical protein